MLTTNNSFHTVKGDLSPAKKLRFRFSLHKQQAISYEY